MKRQTIIITPRDPLIFRDGRPFAEGSKIKVSPWPSPSVTAGSLRTLLGKLNDHHFDSSKLGRVDIIGPLPLWGQKLFSPAPLDCVISDRRALALTPAPYRDGEGTDMPDGLLPLLLPPNCRLSKNKDDNFPWWSMDKVVSWMADERISDDFVPAEQSNDSRDFLAAMPLDQRTHVDIDPETGAAKPNRIFTTSAADFRLCGEYDPLNLALQVGWEDASYDVLQILDVVSPVGGERRPARWRSGGHDSLWHCPAAIKKALQSGTERIRLMLATPAYFKKGWKPDWLDKDKSKTIGVIPGSKMCVQLVAAAIGKYTVVSGWSYGSSSREKPSRKLVPAGSVYFFKVLSGNPAELSRLWLRPMSGKFLRDSRGQYQGLGSDGFGAALWGTWNKKS